MTLVDIGANLANKSFARDLDATIERSRAAGVSSIIVTGTNLDVARRAREIARANGFRSTAGFHPHHAKDFDRDAYAEIGALLAEDGVVAVGECGLDFDRNFSPREDQLRAFEMQLDLAEASKKPVFLHERSAHADFARILERRRPGLTAAVVHCFTGTREELERYVALDLHIGITGWICDERRGHHLREIVGLVPRGRLMIETDAPYLLPRDLPNAPKDRRNEPAFLPHVARAVASARGETFADLAAHTTKTASAFFGLKESHATS